MSSSATTRYSAAALPRQSRAKPDTAVNNVEEALQTNDETILARVIEGDRDAFSVIFRRYARIVHNVGQRILLDKAEADDLVQEVFLYLHRKSGLFDSSKGSARSWIVQVAYTQAFLRRRQLKSQGFYMSGITDKPLECVPSSSTGAHYDHTLEGLFGRNGWKKIVEGLTEDQRETFRLHFFEGYTFTEIAEKLGQSYVSIRHHYYRGVEKLRKHVEATGWNR
jgi:RNA polymerase sigma-70 factor (ECF subfamily)